MMENKKVSCQKDTNRNCILRLQKSLPCCLDDLNETLEILHPSLDTLNELVEKNKIDKYTFSKLMYLVDMIYLDDDTDIKIFNTIKATAYFCYAMFDPSKDNTECIILGKSFISESIKWISFKLLEVPLGDKDLYLVSIMADFETIKNIFEPEDNYNDEDIDDIFF